MLKSTPVSIEKGGVGAMELVAMDMKARLWENLFRRRNLVRLF